MVKFLNRNELEKLTTQRLLAYKNKLMKVPESPSWDESDDNVVNKTSSVWIEVYEDVKAILATREHVEKKETCQAIIDMQSEGGSPSGTKTK